MSTICVEPPGIEAFLEPAGIVDLAEIDTASPWCQRWAGRNHSWRHASEGGFDPSRFEVHPIDEATAKAYVIAAHYSGS